MSERRNIIKTRKIRPKKVSLSMLLRKRPSEIPDVHLMKAKRGAKTGVGIGTRVGPVFHRESDFMGLPVGIKAHIAGFSISATTLTMFGWRACAITSLRDTCNALLDAKAFKSLLAVLKWANANMKHVDDTVLVRVAEAGKILCLRLCLAQKHFGAKSYMDAIKAAAANGHSMCVKVLLPMFHDGDLHKVLYEILYESVKHGRLSTATMIAEKQVESGLEMSFPDVTHIVNVMVDNGRSHCLRRMIQILPSVKQRQNDALKRAAICEQLQVMQMLLKLETVESLRSPFSGFFGSVCEAAKRGSVKALKLLLSFLDNDFGANRIAFALAASHGHLDCVQFLHLHLGSQDIHHLSGIRSRAVHKAARAGHYHVANYIQRFL